MENPVSYRDILDAASRIEGIAVRTPLIENLYLNDFTEGRVFLKLENLQHVGAFKFRGAYNRLSALDTTARQAGVVAWSSGNHAQGVAAAAKMLGIEATIIMPEDAPYMKIENTRAFGAHVHLYNRYTESREEIGTHIAAEKGAVIVPPFDDPYIIAGQGTIGLEIMADLTVLGIKPDAILVPCSGGGLCAGVTIAVKETSPNTQIYTLEPAAYNDTEQSLAAGHRIKLTPDSTSICDALMAPSPGELTFPIMHAKGVSGISVTDDEVKAAIRFAYQALKIIIEPGGATGLAAILAKKCTTQNKNTVLVISGGNIDPHQFRECIR